MTLNPVRTSQEAPLARLRKRAVRKSADVRDLRLRQRRHPDRGVQRHRRHHGRRRLLRAHQDGGRDRRAGGGVRGTLLAGAVSRLGLAHGVHAALLRALPAQGRCRDRRQARQPVAGGGRQRPDRGRLLRALHEQGGRRDDAVLRDRVPGDPGAECAAPERARLPEERRHVRQPPDPGLPQGEHRRPAAAHRPHRLRPQLHPLRSPGRHHRPGGLCPEHRHLGADGDPEPGALLHLRQPGPGRVLPQRLHLPRQPPPRRGRPRPRRFSPSR